MSEPKTLAECLDAARDGDEFGAVLGRLFAILEAEAEK
jgi:hypothetical protein